MLRDVYQRQNRRPPPLDHAARRSNLLADFRTVHRELEPYIRNLASRVHLMRTGMGTLAASEVPSTGHDAAQPPEWPPDHFDVFDFVTIPIDRPADLKAFITQYPMAMDVSEVDKLRDAAYRAIFERGDKEQARDYVRHAIALCYASYTETVGGLHRMLTSISTYRGQRRFEFDQEVELEVRSIERAVWTAMDAVAEEEAQRVRSEQPRPQEHMAVTRSEGEEAGEDNQGRPGLNGASQAMEGALSSSSQMDDSHAGGDEGP